MNILTKKEMKWILNILKQFINYLEKKGFSPRSVLKATSGRRESGCWEGRSVARCPGPRVT